MPPLILGPPLGAGGLPPLIVGEATAGEGGAAADMTGAVGEVGRAVATDNCGDG